MKIITIYIITSIAISRIPRKRRILDDARKEARKGKGNIVMVGKKGNKVRLEIVQNLLSLRL